MYNNVKTRLVPNFKVYNIIANIGMIYICIIEYSNLLLFNKYKDYLL